MHNELRVCTVAFGTARGNVDSPDEESEHFYKSQAEDVHRSEWDSNTGIERVWMELR